MAIDFDTLVLGPCMNAFAVDALLLQRVSAPGAPAAPIRGVYTLTPQDIVDDFGGSQRADGYTFGVRVSEFGNPAVTRGDQISNIDLPFLAGRTFTIEDTGDDDGYGHQLWVLKEDDLTPPETDDDP
ncbi:head-tail joining protein [Chelatococcus reniformis]|uniref:Uncharacterized protein n=1 Tax=Chelatococcus reniformis TaxID=1494448 RepID=A0A916UWC4_9HYPH|nr:hypothetical protein [Chelatococcus reniformis]GGC90387.1 hypothetical protein GCM10010994_55270 [Chelatococcus reniformis]